MANILFHPHPPPLPFSSIPPPPSSSSCLSRLGSELNLDAAAHSRLCCRRSVVRGRVIMLQVQAFQGSLVLAFPGGKRRGPPWCASVSARQGRAPSWTDCTFLSFCFVLYWFNYFFVLLIGWLRMIINIDYFEWGLISISLCLSVLFIVFVFTFSLDFDLHSLSSH